MNTGMKPDVIRLLLMLGISLLIGFVLGRVFLFCTIGLLLTIAWYFRALAGFLNYVRYDIEDQLPEMPGIINELIRGFEQLRSDYRQRELRLADIITRYEETTAALPDAVVVTSEDGRIEWANKKAGDYLGINWPVDNGQRLSNLIRSPELLNYLHQQKARPELDVLEQVSPVDGDVSLEIRAIQYGDSFMLLVARDVTELQRINRVRKDFIANASHELRTPLTVIAGYLEAFEGDAACPRDWVPKITQMRGQADRMQRLIEDLLELSRLESAKKMEHMEDVHVTDMLETIIREAQSLSGAQQHQFVKNLDSELCLLGEPHELYNAFSNIIFNAVQYTPMAGRITIHWYQDGTGAHLGVEDTGDGIEERHLSRVTERFYRIDKGRSRSRGGTGLGLAIVKHVLGRHKGRLYINSTVGKGSLFRCDFPPEMCVVQHPPGQQAGAT